MKRKLLLFGLAAFALFAQKQAPRLVEVNVIVRDKAGPVAGLTQKDFTLFDKGKEQKIAWFAASSNRPAGQPLPPNVYSNRAAIGAPPAGVTFILMDSLNTRSEVQSYARTELLKVIEEIKPSDRVVLGVLGEKLGVLTDPRLDEGQAGALEKWLRENSVVSGMDITNRLTNTTGALATISADLRHFSGRKSLVWIAGGFPVSVDHYGAEGPPGFEDTANRITARDTSMNAPTTDPTQIDRNVFQKEFSPAMLALNFAAISVYAVDGHGLMDIPSTKAAPASIRGNTASSGTRGTDALRILVDDSGGRVSESTNDIQASLRQAIRDSEVSYTLGFYPDAKSLDTRFHALKVQVDRPGVELHYRQGYVALPEPASPEKQRTEANRQALVNPLAEDGIGLIGVYQKLDQPKPGSFKTTVVISAADIELEQNGDQYSGELEVLLSARSADGKDRGTVRQGLQLKLTQAQYDTVMKQGMPYAATLDTTGDVVELRAVVCDHRSSRVGSLIMPVK